VALTIDHSYFGGPVILVVDKDEVLRRAVDTWLTRLGNTVLAAESGEQALDVVETSHVDMILCALDLPDIRGVDLLAEVNARCTDVPVVLLADANGLQEAVSCIRAGAANYLAKPLDFETAAEVIEQVLQETYTGRYRSGAYDQVLAGYRIIQKLGEGSLGIVYLVETADGSDPSRYALKVLREGDVLAGENRPVAIERFIREGEVAAQLNHPNVVSVTDYGVTEDESMFYIVYEYVQGRSLHEYLASESLTTEQRLEIIHKSAMALESVHQVDIIHRDVKPENIMITDDFEVKVMDFGLCRPAESDLTMANHIMGTPLYISPEQLVDGNVDHRSDIFSLGSVAYQIFTGVPAFAAHTLPQVLDNVIAQAPVRPRELNPELPEAIERILGGMLRKEPDERYQSMVPLILDIEDFLHDGDLAQTRSGESSLPDWL
jgi:serine/threonine protein kinase